MPILSINGLSAFFYFVNVFKAPNLYCFLVVRTFTFNLVKKIISISYLVSFLSQFKTGRTSHAFQTYSIVLFPMARTHCKNKRSYVPYMIMKPWKKGTVKFRLPNFVLAIVLLDFLLENAKRSGRPELKLMRLISRPLSIHIVTQHVRLQRSSMYRMHAFKKK